MAHWRSSLKQIKTNADDGHRRDHSCDWNKEQEQRARTMATIKTAHGNHGYCLSQFRTMLGAPGGITAPTP